LIPKNGEYLLSHSWKIQGMDNVVEGGCIVGGEDDVIYMYNNISVSSRSA
jgi:hypothetical protein